MLGVVLFLILLLSLLFKSGFFNIKKIEITGKDSNCISQDQLIASSQIIGRNLFSLDTINLTKKIEGKFICIKEITLSKILPNRIKAEVWYRQPKATLITLKDNEASASSILENIATPSANQSQTAYLMDDKGVVFSKDVQNLSIPKIFLYDPNLFLGKREEENRTKNILKILNKAEIFGLDINTTMISGNYFIIFSTPKVIFKLDNNVDTQIASLQLILKIAKINRRTVPTEVGIDESNLEFIDLRFDKPIIKIAPKK